MVHATIPKGSNNSCNVTVSHTRQAAQIIPRSNGFVERMVRVAKKLIDKAGKEGKPWISGLFDYGVTPQSCSIASPLQFMTQHTPREKNLPKLPSALGAPDLPGTHQKAREQE